MDERRARTVVMTGVVSDVALATMSQLTDAGAHVVLAANGPAERVGAVVVDPSIAGYSGLLDAALSRYGRLDAWINDTDGVQPVVSGGRGSASRSSGLSVIHGSHTALSHFESVGRGVLVNITGSTSPPPATTEATYVAVPEVLLDVDVAITRELADRGFDEIAVYWAHGFPATPPWVGRDTVHLGMLDGMPPGGDCDETATRIVRTILDGGVGGSATRTADRDRRVGPTSTSVMRQTFGRLHPSDAAVPRSIVR